MIRINVARDRVSVVTAFGVDLPQFSSLEVLGIWLAVTLPVALIAWVAVPLLVGPSGFAAFKLYWLLIPIAAIVQIALVAWFARNEDGSWTWKGVKRQLRLNLPLSPVTATPSPWRLWWVLPWALLLFVLTAAGLLAYALGWFARPAVASVGTIGLTGSVSRIAFGLVSPRPEYAGPLDLISPSFAGQWRWAAVILPVWIAGAIAEELLFRGLLLPRTRAAFGRWRGPVNGALYALYHVHQPWAIPLRALQSVTLVRPARLFASTVVSLGVRAAEGAVVAGLVLYAVLTPPLRPVPARVELPYRSWQPAPAESRRGAAGEMPAPDATGVVDLRGFDLSALDLREAALLVGRAWFDDRTVWPEAARMPAGFDVPRIMGLAKNPGLGVRGLHEQGITGRGVSIGMVDRVLLTGHDEYKDRLDWYEEIDTGLVGEPAQMHGAAVASLAVGRTVGVAPGARLFYVGVGESGAARNLADVARGIQRLLELNWRLPPERRMQIISLSVGWDSTMPGCDAIEDAVRRAAASGVFVISPNLERTYGFRFQGLGRQMLADPDRVESYEPGLFWADQLGRVVPGDNSLFVPMDSRAAASPTGTGEYAFYREGGWSWCTPYLAGLYALALQVNPVITPERFWGAALRTGHVIVVNRNGAEYPLGPVVDPPALIAALGR
jgi:membrane protease YdiL (CAAX protease family)